MKRLVLIAIFSFLLGACSYYAPTAQLQESETINNEELALNNE